MFEDDRAFVLCDARRLWGDLDNFNKRVKEEVCSQISAWASTRRAAVPYSTLVLGASPCLFWGLNMAAKHRTFDLKLRDVVYGMTLTLLHVPLLFAIMGFMCEIRFAICHGVSMNALSKLVLLLLALILGASGIDVNYLHHAGSVLATDRLVCCSPGRRQFLCLVLKFPRRW